MPDDWTKFFRQPVYVDPDADVVRTDRYRVDNWSVEQQFDDVGQHRLKVYNRSKAVYSSWSGSQEFASVDLDKSFGSMRGWFVYGCSPQNYWSSFPAVFKVQLAMTKDEQPLQPGLNNDDTS